MAAGIDGVWDCPQQPEPLIDWLEGRLQGIAHVESVQRSGPRTLNITSTGLSVWAIVVAILLFPIGLFALMAKDRFTARIQAETSSSGGTRIRLDGKVADAAARRLNECYAQLRAPATA